VLGAVTSTLGAFVAPWALAAVAAQHVKRFAGNRYLKAFGAGAAPAVVGVLGLTVVDLGREAFASWPFVVVGVVVLALARWTSVHPVVLLILGGVAGYLITG
jgi:chromate transport protein ChrA